MQIFVKALSYQTISLELEPMEAIGKLKAIIAEEICIPCYEIRLVFAGRELNTNLTLKDYFIVDGSTVIWSRHRSKLSGTVLVAWRRRLGCIKYTRINVNLNVSW